MNMVTRHTVTLLITYTIC